jgi:hypothetical protein
MNDAYAHVMQVQMRQDNTWGVIAKRELAGGELELSGGHGGARVMACLFQPIHCGRGSDV